MVLQRVYAIIASGRHTKINGFNEIKRLKDEANSVNKKLKSAPPLTSSALTDILDQDKDG